MPFRARRHKGNHYSQFGCAYPLWMIWLPHKGDLPAQYDRFPNLQWVICLPILAVMQTKFGWFADPFNITDFDLLFRFLSSSVQLVQAHRRVLCFEAENVKLSSPNY